MDKKICPKARECGEPYCVHKVPHEENDTCEYLICSTSDCIPYVEPSSPKDKHCLMGHTLPLDTDVSDQCRGGCGDYYPDDRGDCTNLRQALQPEPMPLKVGDVIQPRSFVFPEKALAKHDQQVRKDFAEECIKILSEETSKIRVRIRAMAEKE